MSCVIVWCLSIVDDLCMPVCVTGLGITKMHSSPQHALKKYKLLAESTTRKLCTGPTGGGGAKTIGPYLTGCMKKESRNASFHFAALWKAPLVVV